MRGKRLLLQLWNIFTSLIFVVCRKDCFVLFKFISIRNKLPWTIIYKQYIIVDRLLWTIKDIKDCYKRYIIVDCYKSSEFVTARRFYLTQDMANLSPFIQGSLKLSFTELFFHNLWLKNQYKYIAFNIFSCRILIISYEILIITWIYNEIINELIIYAIAHRIIP